MNNNHRQRHELLLFHLYNDSSVRARLLVTINKAQDEFSHVLGVWRVKRVKQGLAKREPVAFKDHTRGCSEYNTFLKYILGHKSDKFRLWKIPSTNHSLRNELLPCKRKKINKRLFFFAMQQKRCSHQLDKVFVAIVLTPAQIRDSHEHLLTLATIHDKLQQFLFCATKRCFLQLTLRRHAKISAPP